MITGSPERDRVSEVMSRPEFAYPRSIPERIGDWMGDRIDDLFNRAPSPSIDPRAAAGGGLSSLLGWLLVIVALAVLVVVVVLVVRRWVPRVRERTDPETTVETEHRRAASQWAREAAAHEAAGEWKLAIRARFRELVRVLVDRGQVADLPGRTTGELLFDLEATTPGAVEDFGAAALLFELPWYADVPTGRSDSERFRELADQVLAAGVARRIDTAPVAAPGRVEVAP